jgi:hypothetical protein
MSETNAVQSEESIDELFRRWQSAAMREYYAEIEGIAEEACKESEYDADGARDFAHKSIDGCQRVIYTFRASLVPLLSDSDGAEWCKDAGIENPTTEQIAYGCMIQDTEEKIADLIAINEHD